MRLMRIGCLGDLKFALVSSDQFALVDGAWCRRAGETVSGRITLLIAGMERGYRRGGAHLLLDVTAARLIGLCQIVRLLRCILLAALHQGDLHGKWRCIAIVRILA